MSEWIPEPLFRQILQNVPICTVDVALFDKEVNKTLVFRRANAPLQGHWFTLGGRLRKEESLLDCAVRQVREEAGLTLNKEDLFWGGFFEEIHELSRFGKEVSYHCVNLCWACLIESNSDVRLDAQHDTWEWRSIDDPAFHPFLAKKLESILPTARTRRCM